MRRSLSMICALGLGACGVVDYDDLPDARFEGVLHVVWIGEGSDFVGDGRFVYLPDETAPLRLVRSDPEASVAVIEPPAMFTDGGSIPRPATLFGGLSPWGYGPAYVIHDWIFVARQCLNDGVADPVYTPYAAMEFQESAQVIAEAIQALVAADRVAENQVSPRVIAGVVSGPASYRRWVAEDECASRAVPDALEELLRLNLPGAMPFGRESLLNTLPEPARRALGNSQYVATFSF